MTFEQDTIIYGRVMDIQDTKVLYGVSPLRSVRKLSIGSNP